MVDTLRLDLGQIEELISSEALSDAIPPLKLTILSSLFKELIDPILISIIGGEVV
jgi:hypothetical protein